MIRNVIFDLGAVLFEWNPVRIVQTFTDSTTEQNILLKEVIHHPDWLSLDRGTMLLAEEIPKFAARTDFTVARMQSFIDHVLDSLQPIQATENLLYQVLDKHFSAYYLTNMSNAFFETLHDRNEFFSLFAGGIVSGREFVIKPEPQIYQLLLDRYDLQPEQSLYIDDNADNVKAAKSLGFHAVQFEQTDACFSKIRDLLKIYQ
ncbi:HAD superfamily hydrolase [Photobacterium marinum]|uniref:HAD superfamily hydrolase n=1 Tax=Photobacterium marinum TaxID=1056511 RepID=L8JAH3_9GAMM|nr:HAD family phosphatase [Photobacterium marinum]ELR65766.1 HAD superfamily hydrolase [Photobacterium marinum]